MKFQRYWLWVIMLISSVAMADGKFFPQAEFAATPEIPSQAALIVYRDGIETLIVSSAVDSESADLGWVIPLPAEPTELAKAEPGILTSLKVATRPKIFDRTGRAVAVARGTVLCALIFLLLFISVQDFASALPSLVKVTVLIVLVGLLVGSVLLPSLGRAGSTPGLDPTPGIAVTSMQRVGDYDVSVLRARNAGALDEWLSDNGLQGLGGKAQTIVDDYIEREWCFVVAKLVRDEGGAAATHPILARFPVNAPVYPMKLTALADSTTRLDLFVLADKQASTSSMRCVWADQYTLRQVEHSYGISSAYRADSLKLPIGQPEMVDLMWDGCVLTRLTADLSPPDMQEDITIGLGPLETVRDQFHSERGRRDRCLVVLLIGLSIIFLLGGVIFRANRRPPRWQSIVALSVLVATFALTAAMYLSLDVRPIREGSRFSGMMHSRVMQATAFIMTDGGIVTDALLNEDEDAYVRALDKADLSIRANPFTGEPIRLERSPGNFAFRRIDGKAYLCVYDEHACEDRIELPAAPSSATQPAVPDVAGSGAD